MNQKKGEKENTPKNNTPKPWTKNKSPQNQKVGCKNCQQPYEKLQEEKFQRIVTNKEAEFWDGLQKSIASDMEKLQNITKIAIIQEEQIERPPKNQKEDGVACGARRIQAHKNFKRNQKDSWNRCTNNTYRSKPIKEVNQQYIIVCCNEISKNRK